ncbi:glycoside hydrolase family 3 C-terminal domain-containing protein [Pelagicoccus sp. SDUM812003]|uniref:beta-glucosidase family protein n=1 Tax=Pelagicoccus sp. SDUM812003 TaxID=3041267 RepID=UPI00280E56BE|nr:glycoside hydrolase family 3 C-terminal domain-containing protein [Pelagicoccus sp. SDUM812003]MDQ8201926.1 glycoside hydrolase family 3 C-terminal domain-containing protein [Pelagicoccus sp. SDUM812003]
MKHLTSLLAGALLLSSNSLAASDETEPFFSRVSDAEVEAVLDQLTLDEKVSLLHGSGMFYSGGVPRLGISEMAYTDGPIGVREEIERDSWNPAGRDDDYATYFPSGTALAATWDPDLAERYGAAIGAETRARGKDMLLAPSINVIRTPLCGRNYEYFSEEPFLTASLAGPYVKGVQSQDVFACVKHFVANNQETNRGSISVEVDETTFRELYLRPFESIVKTYQPGAVMGAYNRIRGTYACENPYLLDEILKGEWAYPGIVVSDWAATHSTKASIEAGLDVEMGTEADFENYYFAQPLIEGVKSGAVARSEVDEAARRVLRVMLATGKTDPDRAQGAINTKEHSALVREVARNAIVLLKDHAKLLPLDPSKYQRIAVIGDNATRQQAMGGFGASVKARYEVTPLQGLQNAIGDSVELTYARGYRPNYFKTGEGWVPIWEQTIDQALDPALLEEAIETARAADLVIFVAGTNRDVESEAADRKNLTLPFGQDALLTVLKAVNPNILTVVVAGAPVDLNIVDAKSDTLVWAWYNGSETGNALSDVLLGKANPSGKLPFTLPKSLDQIGAHALDAFPGDGETVRYKEGLLVGYRWLDAHQLEPLYPFGHGLSYSQFELGDAHVSDGSIQLEITNSSDLSGAETVQAYIEFPDTLDNRPVRQLAAFRKVDLDAGQSKLVSLDLPESVFQHYDEQQAAFRIESGDYVIRIGSSSRDLPLSVTVRR